MRHLVFREYGIRNLIIELMKVKPKLTTPAFHAKEPVLICVKQIYEFERERALTSDALIVEVRLCQ
jgi:hypothetical protein